MFNADKYSIADKYNLSTILPKSLYSRYNGIVDFADWITKKYVAWRGNAIGNDRSISEFADMVGISQPTMSRWMKKGGQKPRDQKSIVKLVEAFGPEVYDILGLPRPGTGEEIDLARLPEDMQRRLRAATREVNQVMEDRGLYGSDPEAEKVTIEIFEKYGLKYVATEIVDDES